MISFFRQYEYYDIRNKLLMLFGLNVIDLLFTMFLIGTGFFSEGNPIMAFFMADPLSTVAVSSWSCLLHSLPCWQCGCAHRHTPSATQFQLLCQRTDACLYGRGRAAHCLGRCVLCDVYIIALVIQISANKKGAAKRLVYRCPIDTMAAVHTSRAPLP